MSEHLTTFSGAERVDECPASAVIAVQVHSTGDAADRGDAIHAFLEAVLANHLHIDSALAAVPEEWRGTCAKIDWDKILEDVERDSVRCEVAYAIHVNGGTVRKLGEGIQRRYDVSATEIPGTLDIEAMGKDGRPRVKDFKTGRRLKLCSENMQMRCGAYVIHKLTGAPEVVAQLVYIEEDGSVFIDEHVFDAFDLADFPRELRRVLAGIVKVREAAARGELHVSEGDWCRFCPAFRSCPAKTELIRRVALTIPALDAEIVAATPDIEGAIAALTPEQVGVAWAKWKELEPMFDRVGKALKEYAKNGLPEAQYIPEGGTVTPIVLPDGKVLKAIRCKGRDTINAGRALALARDYGAKEEEVASCMGRTDDYVRFLAVKPKAEKEPKEKRVSRKRADEQKEASNG